MPWISLDDVVGLLLWALDTPTATGTSTPARPNPVTNREFSKALGRALHRPAVLPVPKLALMARLGGELAQIATSGQRALPRRALDDGYAFRHPELDDALRATPSPDTSGRRCSGAGAGSQASPSPAHARRRRPGPASYRRLVDRVGAEDRLAVGRREEGVDDRRRDRAGRSARSIAVEHDRHRLVAVGGEGPGSRS